MRPCHVPNFIHVSEWREYANSSSSAFRFHVNLPLLQSLIQVSCMQMPQKVSSANNSRTTCKQDQIQHCILTKLCADTCSTRTAEFCKASTMLCQTCHVSPLSHQQVRRIAICFHERCIHRALSLVPAASLQRRLQPLLHLRSSLRR